MTRVCFVGAGAVGGYLGAHMSKADVDVTLVDAWPEHVDAMRRKGLTVRGMNGAGSIETPVRALHVSDVPQLVREKPFDVAFIAVKSYDTEWATQLVLPYLSPTGCVVSLQNGINEETIASIAGWSRTLGCSVSALAAELVEPGLIVRNSPLGDEKKAGLRVGELHGQDTPRARLISGLLAHGDTCKVTSNLWGERWSKLTINAMRNGVCALTGMTGKQRDTNEVSRELTVRLGSSCIRVGRALGLALEPVGGLDLELLARADEDAAAHETITRMIMEVANSRSDAQRPSMGQDILKGRRTETEYINGLVARRGEEVGVDVRIHRRVNEVIKRIEKGELSPSPALLAEIVD
ncbi:2-dehydropantoate 2-reductase [Variovorax sp. HW608]|uniref:ketopantoate reductase family protein n=1 Tax=Variovorax sp. HW608 TaxID=1034889 RepID=UPI00081FCD81|nr:2-dehydropantoate 2-reductase [Variovorax sp. HW608]SCK19293.1 2-dehydropantoate 2-reductase [Variovorax sp. HW608]